MPILYSLVARGHVVLCEYTPTSGTFQEIARNLLQRIPVQDHRKSYSYEGKVFHYTSEGGLVVLCMADDKTPHRISFAFLEDIRGRFNTQFGSGYQNAPELGMKDTFSRVLKEQMERFSEDPSVDKITRVRGEIDEVKGVMIQNIDKVLERGDRIESLVQKTEDLDRNTYEFKAGATTLKRKLWWKNVYLWIAISLICFVILALIIFIILWKAGVIKL